MNIFSKYRQFKEQLGTLWSYCKLFGKLYDFDYSSVLLVEQNQLRRIRKHIAKYQFFVGWEVIVQRMDTAIKLLDIALDRVDIIELVDRDTRLTNSKGEFISPKWKLLKYVNTRNASRFLNDIQVEQVEKGNEVFIADLYEEKAWKLYYKLREQYTRNFWD